MSTPVILTLAGLFLLLVVLMAWAVMRAPDDETVVTVVEDEPDPLYPGHTHHVVHTHTVDVSPGLAAGTVMGAAVGAAVTEAIVEAEIEQQPTVVYNPPAYNGGDTYEGGSGYSNDGVSSSC